MNSVLNLSANIAEELKLTTLGINLVLSGILSYVLGIYYIKFGKSLSNRSSLGKDFTLICLTTTLIISVVKSSLALSLGLVGALSIVRFRAAIKEPEELSYLFLAIAIGLGFGAGQTIPTIFAFGIILLLVYIRNRYLATPDTQNLYINFEAQAENSDEVLKKVTELLAQSTQKADLKRIVKNNGFLQTTFLIDLDHHVSINKIITDLSQIDDKANVTFIDQSRFFKG